MRPTATALALVGLALLPATAAAKGPFVELSSTPVATAAGEPWIVQFSQESHDGPVPPPAGETPTVVITKTASGESLSFPGRRIAGDERYHARVVFPSAGTWNYRVDGFGEIASQQFWDPVEILAPESQAAAPAADADSGSSLPWGFLVGGFAIACALASAAWWLVRRRTGPAFS